MSSAAQNAIALLIEMAESGEIDPWDVQVVDVFDRFLEQLQQRPSLTPLTDFSRSRYEADLSESGEAFLYASILILLKADALARLEFPPAEVLEEFVESFDDLAAMPQLPAKLEQQLRRRAVALPPQQRRVTLSDLIEQLEQVAQSLADPPARSRRRQPKPAPRRQAIQAIAHLAHQENLAETAAALGDFLQRQWSALQPENDWLNFEDLVQLWSQTQAGDHHLDGDRVGVFWALLFLAAQSVVELQQDSLYSPLWIRCLSAFENPIAVPLEPTVSASV